MTEPNPVGAHNLRVPHSQAGSRRHRSLNTEANNSRGSISAQSLVEQDFRFLEADDEEQKEEAVVPGERRRVSRAMSEEDGASASVSFEFEGMQRARSFSDQGSRDAQDDQVYTWPGSPTIRDTQPIPAQTMRQNGSVVTRACTFFSMFRRRVSDAF